MIGMRFDTRLVKQPCSAVYFHMGNAHSNYLEFSPENHFRINNFLFEQQRL